MESAETDVAEQTNSTIGPKLAPYNPTNVDCIHLALNLLKPSVEDVVYDLGCGDGRFLIEASKLHGSKGVGIEYDAKLCERAIINVLNQEQQHNVEIIHANVVDVDLSRATMIFVYLVPAGIELIKPALELALARGVRIVTYVFSLPGVVPREVMLYKKSTKLYYYSCNRQELQEVDNGCVHHVSNDNDTVFSISEDT